MFQMTNVTKAYRTDLLETHALREFSLTVDKGEFVAVTGPSGSGKTTFLNVAGLLETFDSGSYTLDGDDVLKVDRGAFYEAGGGAEAYVVHDGVAEREPIKTGAVSVREVEILDGLAEGDQIVISDTDDFKNSARVLLAD